jgi:hypothetical protein
MRTWETRVRDGSARKFSSSLSDPLLTEGGTFKGISIDNPRTNTPRYLINILDGLSTASVV